MKNKIFLVYIKNGWRKYYVLWKRWRIIYTVVDQYINSNRYLGYKDSYNYYDIDVDKILLFKKINNEYFIRYNNVNKLMILPLELKIFLLFYKKKLYKKNFFTTQL